ncbi:unnamed protein product [marine sediment metagenome]|uniref:Uncharacterized protein n=1 Tax=marine sediment metagenome TaxID=412755 RepID=X1HKU1_9ZZZZ
MDLKERIQKLKEIMSYLDDITYYTLKPKTIIISKAYNYLENIKNDFKKELKISKSE